MSSADCNRCPSSELCDDRAAFLRLLNRFNSLRLRFACSCNHMKQHVDSEGAPRHESRGCAATTRTHLQDSRIFLMIQLQRVLWTNTQLHESIFLHSSFHVAQIYLQTIAEVDRWTALVTRTTPAFQKPGLGAHTS